MFQPRDYQLRAIEATWKALVCDTTTLAVLPTGAGKTVVFSMLAEQWDGPVLVLAHRKELLNQAKDKLQRQCREPVGIDQGQERAFPWGSRVLGCERIVCGSVPTLCKSSRRRVYDPAHPWLVIVDEAHHATAKSYQVILKHFLGGNPKSRVVGVTATPKRTDGDGLIRVFASAAFVYSIREAINDGWLVDVETLRPTVTGLDFSSCKLRAGDLSADDVAAIATQERPLHEVAAVLRSEVGQRQGIVFCANRRHVAAMTAVLQRDRYFGEDRVGGADGDTDPLIREDLIARFRSGRLQVLVNCGLFTEGLDIPNASFLGMCRPTKSLVVYTQALGRIMRPLEGIVDAPGLDAAGRQAAIAASRKPLGLVIDFCGVAGRHKLVDAVDVLHGDKDEATREAVRKVIEKSREPVTFDQAAHQAALEEALLREQIEWRKRASIAASGVDYRVESLGTLAGNEGRGSAATGKPAGAGKEVRRPGEKGPTEGQVRHLRWLGVSAGKIATYTRRQAAVVIDRMRRERGLPIKSER